MPRWPGEWELMVTILASSLLSNGHLHSKDLHIYLVPHVTQVFKCWDLVRYIVPLNHQIHTLHLFRLYVFHFFLVDMAICECSGPHISSLLPGDSLYCPVRQSLNISPQDTLHYYFLSSQERYSCPLYCCHKIALEITLSCRCGNEIGLYFCLNIHLRAMKCFHF